MNAQSGAPAIRSRYGAGLVLVMAGLVLVFVVAAAATSRIRGLQERLTHIEQRLERLEVP